MTDKENDLNELREEARKLSQLLDKPELGISSWYVMLGQVLKRINAISVRCGALK